MDLKNTKLKFNLKLLMLINKCNLILLMIKINNSRLSKEVPRLKK